jgi:integrase/recombinase XerD
MQMRFKFLVEDIDRYGNVRLYVRVPGRRKVRLRAKFGTDGFINAYTAAVEGHLLAPRQAPETKVGSFRHLCIRYYASPTFDASIGRRNHGVGGRSIRSVRSMPASQSLLCSLVMSGNCETN